jgi:transcriptional regulator with XRE-family HTH domain
MPRTDAGLFPALLRHWRTRRGMSQLDLAVAADVSSRHVSFLETARAKPSREMVLRLGATLDVPLRDQNEMLRAGGFTAEFTEPSVDGELPPAVAQAIDRMLVLYEPFPLTVLDRVYNVLRTNVAAMRVVGQFVAEPALMPARLNAFHLLFDPRLCRPFILDWERIAHAMVARLHREVLARAGDAGLTGLLHSLFEYPGVSESWRQPDFSTPSEPLATFRLKRGDLELAFLTTITGFSAPGNVTLEELRFETYLPLDDATERACRRLAAG